jgi:excisionase family DNA binding protein
VLADPQRANELRPDEIPALLGTLEQLRATLWLNMVRGSGTAKRDADAGGGELLTVPEVAAQLRFTRGYVYEAVRRGELPAVRKGKYVRLRREDLESWLDEQREAASLDRSGRLPHSAFLQRRSKMADAQSKRARRVPSDHAGPRSGATTRGPRDKNATDTPGSM